MNNRSDISVEAGLGAAEGWAVLTGPEAIVKGLLEAEWSVSLLVGVHGEPFDAFLQISTDPSTSEILKRHHLKLIAVSDPGRAVRLGQFTARAGTGATVLIGQKDLHQALPALRQIASESLCRESSLVVILETESTRFSCPTPRTITRELEFPSLDPSDLLQLRECMGQAMRLSRAANGPVAVIVDRSLFDTTQTIPVVSNRVTDPQSPRLDLQRSAGQSWRIDAEDVLRTARRLELNLATGLPSPGERVPLGIIVVGSAARCVQHMMGALHLSGRIPVLQLRLIHPIDEAVVQRLLNRCEQVIILESNPGEIESRILEVSESLRRNGEEPASIWGRLLPADQNGRVPVLNPGDTLHPSILVRKLIHLLHHIRPSLQVADNLVSDLSSEVVSEKPWREARLGAVAAADEIQVVIDEFNQSIDQHAENESGQPAESHRLALEKFPAQSESGQVVCTEVWNAQAFLREGKSVLSQAAQAACPWLFIIVGVVRSDVARIEERIRAMASDRWNEEMTIATARLEDRTGLLGVLQEVSEKGCQSIVIANHERGSRFDVASLEKALTQIDQAGFQSAQLVQWPADDACAIRLPVLSIRDDSQLPVEMTSTDSIEIQIRTDLKTKSFRMGVRPTIEEVKVLRSRPPTPKWAADSTRLSPPQPRHAQAGQWRIHLAGYRGCGSGIVAEVLLQAARHMGYHASAIHDPTPIAPGWRSWAQLLFTRPSSDGPPTILTAVTPYGEADVILGVDAVQTLRAVEGDERLRVADNSRTIALLNLGQDERPEILGSHDQESDLRRVMLTITQAELIRIEDFSLVARTWFHTDRVVDLLMLGTAFQMGLVPLTVDAINNALEHIESKGIGRAREVFEFGRRMASDQPPETISNREMDEPVHRTVRRMVLFVSRGEFRGSSRAAQLARLVEHAMHDMPGLSETDPGRDASRDFVMAAYRCYVWGGVSYAQRYLDLIVGLYRADRGDRGRDLTRHAILPLAQAMLIRDTIFIASMATSPAQRRRERRLLNIKPSRGDQLERRYVWQVDLTVPGHRLRMDVRTSDWAPRLMKVFRHLLPQRWRGTPEQRQLRESIIVLVEQVRDLANREYHQCSKVLHELHRLAVEDRLRSMKADDIDVWLSARSESDREE